MGQGIYTAEAMLIAEELEVGLDQIRSPAPPNEELYKQPLLNPQTTGGSTSVRGAWVPLRQAGAAARHAGERRRGAGGALRPNAGPAAPRSRTHPPGGR